MEQRPEYGVLNTGKYGFRNRRRITGARRVGIFPAPTGSPPRFGSQIRLRSASPLSNSIHSVNSTMDAPAASSSSLSNRDNQVLSDHDVQDLLLSSKRINNRTRKACYPCSKRKIKCDREERQPCSNCLKRPHSELCSYDDRGSRSSLPRIATPSRAPTAPLVRSDGLYHPTGSSSQASPRARWPLDTPEDNAQHTYHDSVSLVEQHVPKRIKTAGDRPTTDRQDLENRVHTLRAAHLALQSRPQDILYMGDVKGESAAPRLLAGLEEYSDKYSSFARLRGEDLWERLRPILPSHKNTLRLDFLAFYPVLYG